MLRTVSKGDSRFLLTLNSVLTPRAFVLFPRAMSAFISGEYAVLRVILTVLPMVQ